MGLGRTDLYLSNISQEGIRPPASANQREAAVPGVTLRFANLPKEGESLRAINIVARIRLFSDDWTHLQDIDYGVWVGSSCEVTDMEVGDVRELVLFIIDDDNQLVGLRDMRHVGRFEFCESYVEPISVDWARNVEVILTDQRSHTTTGWVLNVERQGTAFRAITAYPPPQASRLPR